MPDKIPYGNSFYFLGEFLRFAAFELVDARAAHTILCELLSGPCLFDSFGGLLFRQ